MKDAIVFKTKIVWTNWLNVLAILLVWLFEILVKIDFLNNEVDSIINEVMLGISKFSTSGILVMVPLLLIIVFIDYIVWSSTYKNWSILLFEWLILSSPFIYWFLKSDHQKAINLIIIFVFLIFQGLRNLKIKKIQNKYGF